MKLLEKIKQHWIYIIVLLLVTSLYFYFFYGSNLPPRDITADYLPAAETIKISLKEYKDPWPLWMPYGFSGTPFLMKTYLGFDSLLGILLLVIPSTVTSLKLAYVLLFLISGISMYALMVYLEIGKKFALISALVYMLNGHMAKLYNYTWLTTIGGYAIMPLFFLFGMKTIKEKKFVRNSVITGIIMSIMLCLNPDVKVLLWIGLVFALYIIFRLLINFSVNKVTKMAVISAIILITFVGLSAYRIFPNASYIKTSSRGDTSWEVASGRQLPYSDIFTRLIEPIYKGMPQIQRKSSGDHIGIIAFLLASFAVYKKRKDKRVVFFTIVAILSVMIATNTFGLYYLLWHLPFFKSMRYMDRSLFLFVFAGSILAGIGANELFENVKKRKNLIYVSLIMLILVSLWLFNYRPYSYELNEWENVNEAIKDNQILQYLSQERQKEIFRIETWETRGIDWGTDFYNVPLKLEHIYRYDTTWYPPYMNGYLSVANNNPAKLWGILNLKYVTSQTELNVSGFKFVKKFGNCTTCFPAQENLAKAWGPYLYENELFLPRAYIVNNAVLVVGEEGAVTQTIYSIMLNNNFDPKNTVIIRGKKTINDYNYEELQKFNIVFLTQGSVDQNSGAILRDYVNKGGILLPDVTKGTSSVTEEDLARAFSSLNEGFVSIGDDKIKMINFDKREIVLDNFHKGFLVYSEKFSVFDGWYLKVNNEEKRDILNADAMVSAVYLGGNEKNLTFYYSPLSFRIGIIISLVTLMGVIAYFVYGFIKKNSQKSSES